MKSVARNGYLPFTKRYIEFVGGEGLSVSPTAWQTRSDHELIRYDEIALKSLDSCANIEDAVEPLSSSGQ